jgi:DNA (cytosine-5)-methyltransferase 1
MKAIGIFSGIGGIEEGFRRARLYSKLLCEIDPLARSILKSHFPNLPIDDDIRQLKSIPDVDVLAAGFPCQDLSQAGRTIGIRGRHSRLIKEVFRLVASSRRPPGWLVLENVPFMLHLAGGCAMRAITNALVDHGYRWAYRTVDTMAFGLPQRRRRIIIVAARKADPRTVLFSDDAGERILRCGENAPRGFYWTEGRSGLGWARDAVPPLKGGSGVGIPSPPAMWFPRERLIATLDIRDAERLQGFTAGWTRTALGDRLSEGERWRLVGNAVSVPVAKWLGRRLLDPGEYCASLDVELDDARSWPTAGWGTKDQIRGTAISAWPVRASNRGLGQFLQYPVVPLSVRATAGFRSRALKSSLRFEDRFLKDVAHHLRRMSKQKSLPSRARLAA